MPLISIVTPSFNSNKFLSATINSILVQSFTDWELIVVDDCSTDDTVQLVQQFVEQDNRIKLIQLPENSGAAVARNTAIDAAMGRYITFLDSDDLWKEDKLEKQLDFMQKYNIDFSYAAYEKIDENGKVIGRVGVPKKVTYSSLLKVCSVGCLTAMYDTAKLGKVYMPLIRKRQDLGLWLEILKKIPCGYGITDPLAQYRVRSDSISANKMDAAKYTWRLYREVERLNLLRAIYYFSFYAVNGVLRTRFPRLARLFGVLK